MKLPIALTILLLTSSFGHELNNFFEKINKDYLKFNRIAADIAWESSVNPDNPELSERSAKYQKNRIKWERNICKKLEEINDGWILNKTQSRQMYLLCRGPKYSFDEAREMSSLYEELQSSYSERNICIQTHRLIAKSNLTDIEDAILYYLLTVKTVLPPKNYDSISIAAKLATTESGTQWPEKSNNFCLNGEEEVDELTRFTSNEEVRRWLWLAWREKLRPSMREPYRRLVMIENKAARRNGYTDIGASWRDELEIPNLEAVVRSLYEDVKPLYVMLHGIVRFHLRRQYGDIVSEHGAIPAHLLGNLWSQNWDSLLTLITPKTINLDKSIQSLNWTVHHMLKRAEDYYQSLGLPPMSDAFWSRSVFERKNNKTRCHGTAADMLRHGDERLLYCSGTSVEDLYVIHHEMGHIQYYMAYEDQPGIFRAAHSALHETIGDSIMYGVLTPLHLHRLGLVNDSVLFGQDEASVDDDNDDITDHDDGSNRENEIDEISTENIMLLKIALNKLPQIPFALLMDEYRWKYFEGRINEANLNEEYWRMSRELQGIEPIGVRGERYFDAGAKFHVPDNTPYIRYFLSSFLQHQLFEKLCKAAVFGRRGHVEDLPSTMTVHRCDIYGSKAAGKILKDLMSRGHSQHWREILAATISDDTISASALKRYYRPLHKLLEQLIRKHRIPLGW